MKEKRKLFMHITMTFALIGLGATAKSLPKIISYMGGGELARPGATISQSIMAILCIFYLAIGIKTFIDARKS